MDPRLTALDDALAPLGLFVRGAFHPTELDRVPRMPDGGITKTAVLLGNAGNDLWEAFSKVPQAPSERDPLEVWLVSHITAIARATLAHPLFVHQGPPYIPIQDWAQRAESIHRSPIGLLIHPEFGLWHAYRAALCFPDALALPPHSAHSSPCEDCAAKPCLHTCPVGAFEGDRFDADACLTHVDSRAGHECRNGGCRARRGCPVGAQYQYERPAQAFHMAALLRSAHERWSTGAPGTS